MGIPGLTAAVDLRVGVGASRLAGWHLRLPKAVHLAQKADPDLVYNVC
jgi:hypothetical protein